MKRMTFEYAGPVVLVKYESRDSYGEFLIDEIRTFNNPGKSFFVTTEGKVWLKAKFRSFCTGRDCSKDRGVAIEIGDRIYIDGGRVLCEECGKKTEESDNAQ